MKRTTLSKFKNVIKTDKIENNAKNNKQNKDVLKLQSKIKSFTNNEFNEFQIKSKFNLTIQKKETHCNQLYFQHNKTDIRKSTKSQIIPKFYV